MLKKLSLCLILFLLIGCNQQEKLEHAKLDNKLKPMMMFVDNQLYRFGRKHTEKLDDSNSCKLTREVESWVDNTEMPTKNNQVNFNSGTKFKFYKNEKENLIELYYGDNNWYYFHPLDTSQDTILNTPATNVDCKK